MARYVVLWSANTPLQIYLHPEGQIIFSYFITYLHSGG